MRENVVIFCERGDFAGWRAELASGPSVDDFLGRFGAGRQLTNKQVRRNCAYAIT